jgi:hypothetical protein
MMISESGHTTHSRHVENPYLGFLFRCYSDPLYPGVGNTPSGTDHRQLRPGAIRSRT